MALFGVNYDIDHYANYPSKVTSKFGPQLHLGSKHIDNAIITMPVLLYSNTSMYEQMLTYHWQS